MYVEPGQHTWELASIHVPGNWPAYLGTGQHTWNLANIPGNWPAYLGTGQHTWEPGQYTWELASRLRTWPAYLVELLLELLIGIVDAKLLKTVHFEGLKAVDVQNPYEDMVFGASLEGRVDLFHHPVKHHCIEVFGEAIPCIDGL